MREADTYKSREDKSRDVYKQIRKEAEKIKTQTYKSRETDKQISGEAEKIEKRYVNKQRRTEAEKQRR